MKSCFGYVRVSSQKQGEGVSLDAQKDAILRFADANGIAISRWFEEQQTAAKSGRPIFNGMLKALQAGKAEGVVMHKIDRSARNYEDWYKIGILADSGIDIHFATESLDFRSRGGRLTANIQMAVAEDYVRNLRAEVLKGQRGQLDRGFYPFSAPLGYRNNGKHALKTIDPVKGPLVRRAFEFYASGQYSLHSLRREMVEHGLSKPNGDPLSKGSIEKLLANPFYTGVICIRRTGDVYQGAHEPLISAELFETVAEVRAGRSGKKVTRHNHLFRGLFRCGQCGRSMIPERQKGNVYYRCQFGNCPKNSVREERLADAVVDVLRSQDIPSQLLADVATKVTDWMHRNARSAAEQQNVCAMQLAKIDERMTRLEDAAIEQIIDKDSFQKRKQTLLLERAATERKQCEITETGKGSGAVAEFLELVKNLAWHYESADPAGKRELFEIALSNRRVHAKNICVEPSNWLRDTRNALAVLSCADARTTSRTFADETRNPGLVAAEDRAIQRLVELANSSEVERLFSQFMDGFRDAAFGDFQPDDLAA